MRTYTWLSLTDFTEQPSGMFGAKVFYYIQLFPIELSDLQPSLQLVSLSASI